MRQGPGRDLAQELLAMAAEDEAVRAELVADGSLFEGYHSRMAEVHRRNAKRLDAIIDAHGWPGRVLVGEDASQAAFLVLQHAIGSPAVMRRGLPLVQAAAMDGDVDPVQVAMLEDRILSFEGKPQRYGTQFDWDEDGLLNPLPIADPADVDARRRAVRPTPWPRTLRASAPTHCGTATSDQTTRPPAKRWPRPGLALSAGGRDRRTYDVRGDPSLRCSAIRDLGAAVLRRC